MSETTKKSELNDPLLPTDRCKADSDDIQQSLAVWEEIKSILELAVGFFLASVSWIIIKTTDSALLGVSTFNQHQLIQKKL